jgi:hypothetical protein
LNFPFLFFFALFFSLQVHPTHGKWLRTLA